MTVVPIIHMKCALLCKEVYTKKNHIQVRYNRKDNHLIIAIEGTYDWYDWLDNLAVCKRKDVHIGFRKHATYIKRKYNLSRVLSKYKNSKIYLCGHSLGAASVALISYDYKDMYDIETVMFGAPRIGGEHFRILFDDKMFNVIEYKCVHDIVPHLPFACLGYTSLLNNTVMLHPVSHPFQLLSNHGIETYINELDRIYNQQHIDDLKNE